MKKVIFIFSIFSLAILLTACSAQPAANQNVNQPQVNNCVQKDGECCLGNEPCSASAPNCPQGTEPKFNGCDDKCVPNVNCVAVLKSGWQAFESKVLEYSLNYPSGWVAIKTNSQTGAEDANGTKVVFWSRPDYKDFFVPESEGIRPGVYNLTVDYNDQKRAEFLKDPSIKLLSSAPITVDGIGGTQDLFKGPYGEWTTIYLNKSGVIYSLTYWTKSAAEKAVIDEIISSFKFLK